jgi:hypothetical protein
MIALISLKSPVQRSVNRRFRTELAGEFLVVFVMAITDPSFIQFLASFQTLNGDTLTARGAGDVLDDFQGGGLAYLGSKMLMEPACIVGEDGYLVAGAGNCNISESRVEQIGMNPSIGVDQNSLRCESLGTVAGDCVSVIEVPMNLRIELDLTTIVEVCRDIPIWSDRLDHC